VFRTVTAAPKVNQPTLGEMIEEKREALGLTKSEAARLAGVSRGTWHEVESGKRTNMLAGTLDLFDKALGYERGTLRSVSRTGQLPEPVAQSPLRVQVTSTGPLELTNLELRMQLINAAMTMADDLLQSTCLFVRTITDPAYSLFSTDEVATAITRAATRTPPTDKDQGGTTGEPHTGQRGGDGAPQQRAAARERKTAGAL
jgi:transcriptional regulator with XRE-family HTH domain